MSRIVSMALSSGLLSGGVPSRVTVRFRSRWRISVIPAVRSIPAREEIGTTFPTGVATSAP